MFSMGCAKFSFKLRKMNILVLTAWRGKFRACLGVAIFWGHPIDAKIFVISCVISVP